MTKYDYIIWLLPFEDTTQIYANGKLVASMRQTAQLKIILDAMTEIGICDRSVDPGAMYGFGKH